MNSGSNSQSAATDRVPAERSRRGGAPGSKAIFLRRWAAGRSWAPSLAKVAWILAALLPTHLWAMSQDFPGPLSEPITPDRCRVPGITLVLSGGGAWGLIHVGVIQALEERNIHLERIVGTSMGAILGSLHAAGYSGSEIEELVMNMPLEDIFSGYSPRLPPPLDYLPVMVMLHKENDGPMVPELPMADSPLAERMIRDALSGGDGQTPLDFEELIIPLYVIATDPAQTEPVVLFQGDVALAVLASSAIPMVLDPVEIEGRDLVDGGITENIPVSTARRLGAGPMIVSDATAKLDLEGKDLGSITTAAEVLVAILFRQEDPVLEPEDILVRPELETYPKLGFSNKEKRALIRIGYEAALEALGNAESRAAPSRLPNTSEEGGADLGLAPLARGACGGRGADEAADQGGPALEPSVPPADASPVKDRAALLPNLARRSRKIRWMPEAPPAASRSVGAGVGYQHEVGAVARVGMVDSRLLGNRALVAGVLAVGDLENSVEMSLRAGSALFSHTVPLLSVRLSHHQLRRYDANGHSQDTRDITSVDAFLGPERRFRSGWTARAGARFDGWIDPEGPGTRSAFGAEVSLRHRVPHGFDLGMEGTVSRRYSRVAAEFMWTSRVGTARLTPVLRLGLGRNLPYLFTFPLGGSRTFPGLHFGERRGDREALLSLAVEHDLVGPVALGLELASGVGGGVETSMSPDRVLFGARLCLGLNTPIGRVDLGYGWTALGRGALYFRIGEL